MTEIQMKPRNIGNPASGETRGNSFFENRDSDFKISLQTGHVSKLREFTDRMFPSSRMFSPESITREVPAATKKYDDACRELGCMEAEDVESRTCEMPNNRKRKRGNSGITFRKCPGGERTTENEDKEYGTHTNAAPESSANVTVRNSKARSDFRENVQNSTHRPYPSAKTSSFPLVRSPEEEVTSQRSPLTFNLQVKDNSSPFSLSDSFSTLAKTNYILQDLQLKYNEMLHRISSTIEFAQPLSSPLSPRSPIQPSFPRPLLNSKFLANNLNFSPNCIFPNPIGNNLIPQLPLRLNLPILTPYGPTQAHESSRIGCNFSPGIEFSPFPFPKMSKRSPGNLMPIIPYVNNAKLFPNVNNFLFEKNRMNEKISKSENQEGTKCINRSPRENVIGGEREILPLSDERKSTKEKKSHRCIYCGKLYSRKYGLKIHIRTHTGYKPLKCKVCGRPFGDPSNLNKHVRLHAEGDTPYRCEFCGKVLVRRRDLERHVKSRHPSHERNQTEKLFEVDDVMPGVY